MEVFIRDGVTQMTDMADRAMRYGGDSHYFDDSSITEQKVREYLDSLDELEKLKGMKWLLAMLSKGRDVSELFSSVVKNVVVKSVEVKKMVYNYLVHYADYNSACREMALLSINSFQKDMSGSNQFVRGLALRVLTSIRVSDITQIQLLAVQKCAKDSSAYVRKCAATALNKIFAFDPSQLGQLIQILEGLLDDQSTMVLGSALCTFNEICPREYHLLHSNFRTICHLLADLDEWSQIIALDVLIRYTRNQFVDPVPGLQTAVRLQSKQRSQSAMLTQGKQLMQERLARRSEVATEGGLRGGKDSGSSNRGVIARRRLVRKAFYSDEEDVSDEEEFYVNEPEKSNTAKSPSGSSSISSSISGSIINNIDSASSGKNLEDDHNLVLTSAMPLLKSRNCGVVLNVCTLQYYCGNQNPTVFAKVAKALVRILRNHREIQYVVLNTIVAMARDMPTIFEPFFSEFFVKSTDPTFNKLLKLDIMTSICSKDNVNTILKELQVYIKQQDVQLVCASIRAVGKVADCDPSTSVLCLEGLLQVVVYNMQSGKSRYSSLQAGQATSTSEQQPYELIISEAITVLRHLIQQNSHQESAARILLYLTKLLITDEGAIDVPSARASIVWLIGEYYELVGKVAPDVLRILANNFFQEATETKNQILNFAVKLSLRFPNDSTIEKLMTYVLEMSRYDTDVDFRDRSRLVTAFLGLSPSTATELEVSSSGRKEIEICLEELAGKARGIFLAKKMPPTTLLGAVDADGMLHFNIGSLSSLVGHTVSGYEPIPDWQDEQPDLSVRDIKSSLSSAADGNKSYDIKGKDSLRSNFENLYSSSSDDDFVSDKGHGGAGSKGNRRTSRSSSEDSSDDDSSDDSSNSSSSSSDVNNRRARSTQQKLRSSRANRNDSSSDSGSDDSDEEEFVSRPQTAIGNSSRRQTNATSANNSSSNSNSSIYKSTVRPSGGGGVANNSNRGKSLDLFDEGSGGNHSATTVSSSSLAAANIDNRLDTSGTRPSVNGNSDNKKSGGGASSNFDVFDDILLFPNSSANNTSSYSSNNSNTDQDHIININNNVFMGLSSSSSPSFAATTSGVGGGPLNTTAAPPQHRSESEVLTPQKIIIRPELSRGISVGLAIRLGSGPRPSLAADAISAMLVFKNCRDTPIRKIRVIFPSDLKRTSIEDIAVLNPNEERQIPIEMVVSADKSKSYRIDLSSDTGSFSGSLSFYSFDLFYPSAATLIEFNSLRQSLTRKSAMGECVKTIPMSIIGGSNMPMEQLEAEIFRRLQRLLNAYLVQGPAGDFSRDILLSAASRRKGLAMEERLAVTVRVSTSNVVLRAISEDSVLDATILDVLKTQLCNESLFLK